jgi:hypothetical protein
VSDTLGKYGNLRQLFAYHTDGSDLFNSDDPTRQVTHETNPWGAVYGQFCGDSTRIVFNTVIDDHGNSGESPTGPQRPAPAWPSSSAAANTAVAVRHALRAERQEGTRLGRRPLARRLSAALRNYDSR